MSVQLKKSTALANLSLTPLIDVVFLLLIFFLVTARFAEEDRELDVVLPSASEAQPLTVQPKEIFVNIDDSGRYFVDDKVMSIEEVGELLERAVANNPTSQSVIIRADKRVQLDHAVAIMNACNRAGVYDYTLTTDGN